VQIVKRFFWLFIGLLLYQPLGVAHAEPSLEPFMPYLGNWEVDFSATESANEKLRFLYDVTLSDHRRRLSSGQNRLGDSAFQAVTDLRGLVNLGRLAEQITRTAVLDIHMVENTLVVERDDNFSLRCEVGASPDYVENIGYSQCKIQAEALVFELAMPGGLTIEHRLILSPGGDRLSIATTLAANGVSQQFSVSRVYQPFEPGSEGFACQYTLDKGRVCQLSGMPDE